MITYASNYMKWTDEKPLREGWYAFAKSKDSKVTCMELKRKDGILRYGNKVLDFDGFWMGPIETWTITQFKDDEF